MTPRTRIAPARASAALAIVTFVSFISFVTAGCGGRAPSTPSAPTPVNPLVTPTVISISPSVGSTSGDTPVVIVGTGLQHGVTVTFGGIERPVRLDIRDVDKIYVATPPHAEGVVEVVVTNAAGQAG